MIAPRSYLSQSELLAVISGVPWQEPLLQLVGGSLWEPPSAALRTGVTSATDEPDRRLRHALQAARQPASPPARCPWRRRTGLQPRPAACQLRHAAADDSAAEACCSSTWWLCRWWPAPLFGHCFSCPVHPQASLPCVVPIPLCLCCVRCRSACLCRGLRSLKASSGEPELALADPGMAAGRVA